MRHKSFATKIAYSSIFARTVEEAAENLLRQITKGQCGFDEGVAAWRAVVADYLQPTEDLSDLNRFGATLTPAQWRQVFEQVRSGLT